MFLLLFSPRNAVVVILAGFLIDKLGNRCKFWGSINLFLYWSGISGCSFGAKGWSKVALQWDPRGMGQEGQLCVRGAWRLVEPLHEGTWDVFILWPLTYLNLHSSAVNVHSSDMHVTGNSVTCFRWDKLIVFSSLIWHLFWCGPSFKTQQSQQMQLCREISYRWGDRGTEKELAGCRL